MIYFLKSYHPIEVVITCAALTITVLFNYCCSLQVVNWDVLFFILQYVFQYACRDVSMVAFDGYFFHMRRLSNGSLKNTPLYLFDLKAMQTA